MRSAHDGIICYKFRAKTWSCKNEGLLDVSMDTKDCICGFRGKTSLRECQSKKKRPARDGFVLSRHRRDHLHVNAKIRSDMLTIGLCATDLRESQCCVK